jgi:hypothetical protein
MSVSQSFQIFPVEVGISHIVQQLFKGVQIDFFLNFVEIHIH